VPALHARAIALSRRDRPQAAIEDLDRALHLSPNHERSLALAVNLLGSTDRRGHAAELANRLVALNPWVAEYHVMLARIHAVRREWPEVLQACRTALRLDPTNLPARMALILAARQLGDQALVRSEARTYLQLDASDAERRIVEAWLREAR
jgi:tetratricopeptide (TPR) repeat protein